MNRSRRALIGALVLLTAFGAACVPPPSGGGGEPPPDPVFPEKGCYTHVTGNDFKLGTIDTVDNGEMTLSQDGTCTKPVTPPRTMTLVKGDQATAFDTCDLLEPGTASAQPSSNEVVEGTSDVWICKGGISFGDCVRVPGAAALSVRYKGPIDQLDNANLHRTFDCSDTTVGPATVVVAPTPAIASGTCAAADPTKITPVQILQLVWVCT